MRRTVLMLMMSVLTFMTMKINTGHDIDGDIDDDTEDDMDDEMIRIHTTDNDDAG